MLLFHGEGLSPSREATSSGQQGIFNSYYLLTPLCTKLPAEFKSRDVFRDVLLFHGEGLSSSRKATSSGQQGILNSCYILTPLCSKLLREFKSRDVH